MGILILFDTETTGMLAEDRIIQAAAIMIDPSNKESYEYYNEFYFSEIPIKIEAMAIHGIRQSDIDAKPTFQAGEFQKALKRLNTQENYLIAHNIEFDMGMLKKEGFVASLQLIDTLQCAKHLYEVGEMINGHKLPNHKLQTFRYILFEHSDEANEARFYGAQIKAHDALGDVIVLKLFFREMYKRVKNRFLLNGYDEILKKMVELTLAPVEIKHFPIGKYRGEEIALIASQDPNYIRWMVKNLSLDKNMKYTLEFYL